MAVIDIKKKIIHGKIVYYGPGLCGKTTNLEYINSKVPNTKEMMSLSTEGDRTIFFDFLPMDLGKIRGISTTFKLYTVPGQVRYNLTRKMVLKNVDGVVFVADSQRMMLDSNVESLENLYENLRELRIDPEEIPVVLQYNKRDLPDLMSPAELNRALNSKGYPVFLASAVKGDGVLETLSKISNIVFKKFMASFGNDIGPAKPKKMPAHPKPPKPFHKPEATTNPMGSLPEPTPAATPVAKPAAAPAPAPAASPVAQLDSRALEGFEKLMREQNQKLSEVLDRNTKILEKYGEDLQQFETVLDTLTKIQGSISTLTLIRQDPFAGPAFKKLRDESQRIIKKTREGLATQEDLHKALGQFPGKSNPLPSSGPDPKELVDLRKAVEKLGAKTNSAPQPGVGAKEIRTEVEKIVKQATADLPTKKEIQDLHKSIEYLAKEAGTGSSDDKTLKKLQQEVAKLAGHTDTRLNEIKRSFEKSLADLRSDLLKSLQEGVRPATAAPPEPAPVEEKVEEAPPAVEEKVEEEPPPAEEKVEEEPPPVEEKVEEEPPAEEEEAKEEKAEEEKAEEEDPQKKNAERIARVMVADLGLYHSDDVVEGIKAGDLHERLKKELEEMRKTFNTRVPEEVRADKDFLKEAIDNFVARKRKDMGVE
jgi:small GTP-binding protein